MWTEQAIKDFYLNNILIHELGHLLDDRNSRRHARSRTVCRVVRGSSMHGYGPTRDGRPSPVLARSLVATRLSTSVALTFSQSRHQKPRWE